MTNPSLTDWLTAIGTVGATGLAVVLAGRDIVSRWIFHPRLDVALRQGPPDCVITQITESTPAGAMLRQAFYCRLRIQNNGNRRAQGVEVRMICLWRYDSGSYTEDGDFVPMNLLWSHRGTIGTPVLEPKLPQHCDFCYFQRPIPIGDGKAWMDFATEVQPNQVGPDRWPTKKPPGKYRAEIVITADNAKPKSKILAIDFVGEWSDDPVEMAMNLLRVDA